MPVRPIFSTIVLISKVIVFTGMIRALASGDIDPDGAWYDGLFDVAGLLNRFFTVSSVLLGLLALYVVITVQLLVLAQTYRYG